MSGSESGVRARSSAAVSQIMSRRPHWQRTVRTASADRGKLVRSEAESGPGYGSTIASRVLGSSAKGSVSRRPPSSVLCSKFGWADVARSRELDDPAIDFSPATRRWPISQGEHMPQAHLRHCEETLRRWRS
jgi:hypothetical protein